MNNLGLEHNRPALLRTYIVRVTSHFVFLLFANPIINSTSALRPACIEDDVPNCGAPNAPRGQALDPSSHSHSSSSSEASRVFGSCKFLPLQFSLKWTETTG